MNLINYLVKVCLILCFSFSISSYAQNQMATDSLLEIYHEGTLKDTAKLKLLNTLSLNEVNNPELSLKYAEELINASIEEKNDLYLHRGNHQKGNINFQLGNYEIALAAFFKSEEAASKANNAVGQGIAFMSIADIYSELGNSDNAEIYYDKSISILREADDGKNLAAVLLNAGDEAFNNKKYELALSYFEESGTLFENADFIAGIAYTKGNIGMVFFEQGKDEKAKKYISEAITMLEEIEDYYAISDYLPYLSDIALRQNNRKSAVDYSVKSLELAKKYNLKKQLSESSLQLSKLYEQTGKLYASLEHYKNHIAYRDSLTNIKSVKQMADLRTNYEVSQKQVEVDLLEKDAKIQQLTEKKQKNIIYGSIGGIILISLLALALYKRYLFIKKTNDIIQKETNKSEELLLNILPTKTAVELKQNGKVRAKKFEQVTVMFTDFKNFTASSEHLSPEDLVRSVDYYFSKFDEIIEKYDLEKIKTIGDAYMCAGGLPMPTKGHALKTLQAAFEIVEFMQEAKQLNNEGIAHFDIRIGINTGPVVAGVVGTKKFAYDIWGDTVNVAARMESNSVAGKINISNNTFELIKEKSDCEYRGEIDVKNKGMMKMYFVKALNHNLQESRIYAS